MQWRLATVSATARIEVKDEDRPTNLTGRHAGCIAGAAIPAAGKRVLLMLISDGAYLRSAYPSVVQEFKVGQSSRCIQ